MTEKALLEKGMPASVETELAVIAQPFLSEGAMPYLRGCIEEDCFTTERVRELWRVFCVLFDAGNPITVVGVYEELRKRNTAQSDSISFLAEVQSGVPVITEPEHWVEALLEKARLRRIIRACDHNMHLALLGAPSKEIYESIVSQTALVTENQAGITSTKHLLETHGVERLLHSHRRFGLELPWNRLNGLLAGLQPGQLVLLAAHTSQGKTSAALQMALHIAKQKRSVAYFSLEMEPKSLFRRMVSQVSGINPRIATGMLDYEARKRQQDTSIWLGELPIWLDSSSRNVPAILSSLRRIERDPKLGLVVVDYLQLLQTLGRPGSRAQEVGNLARELKLAAHEFDVPFLVLSQFSRESAKDKRRPELYDLKESGDVENHSDTVIILHAPDLDTELVKRPMIAYVPKQREGPRGKEITMEFNSDTQVFSEMYA